MCVRACVSVAASEHFCKSGHIIQTATLILATRTPEEELDLQSKTRRRVQTDEANYTGATPVQQRTERRRLRCDGASLQGILLVEFIKAQELINQLLSEILIVYLVCRCTCRVDEDA